jgi:PKD repeat protein
MPRRLMVLVLLAALGGLILLAPGCDELVTETIEVTTAGNPTAEFIITPDSGCVPLQVSFDDASSGPVVRWIWNFGDGAYDTIFADSGDVSHTYTVPGNYTVTLSVFDNIDGSDVETKKRAVIAGQSIDSVTISDTLSCPGNELIFTAYDPFGVASWQWAFGDGTILTDSSFVQTHVYDEPGIYQFKLTLMGECGQKILVDTVHILSCGTPLFTASPAEGCEPLTVTFVDQSSPPIDTSADPDDTLDVIVDWLWDFGNGTTLHEQGDSNEVTYASAGSYPVTLTITTDSGGVTSYVDTIVVYADSDQLFTAEPVSACQVPGRQYLVKFTRAAAMDTAWHWDFGDGDTSKAQSPIHAYTAPGIYTVRLIAYGACGTDSAVEVDSGLITYGDMLNSVVFSYIVVPLNADSSIIAFTDQSPAAAVVTRAWYLGTALFPNPTGPTVVDTFAVPNTITVTLWRFNDCDSISFDSTITIP